ATIQEGAIRPLAGALLAANAQNGVHLNPSKRRMVFVRHPEHTVFHRTVLDTRRRPGAARAAFRDYGQFFGFFLADAGEALGLWFKLQFVRNHPRLFLFGFRHRTRLYSITDACDRPLGRHPEQSEGSMRYRNTY